MLSLVLVLRDLGVGVKVTDNSVAGLLGKIRDGATKGLPAVRPVRYGPKRLDDALSEVERVRIVEYQRAAVNVRDAPQVLVVVRRRVPRALRQGVTASPRTSWFSNPATVSQR